MFLFSGIFTKIKLIAMAALAALIPILYIIGRRDGAKGEVVKQQKAALDAAEDRAEFYQKVEQANNEIESNKPRDKRSLVNRLRGGGL
ncbi:hypothetical protein OAT86_01300 [Planktomarina sp.]|jgi:hypothetical protein|nr:hypothetical protein [Planktomarina sp.]